MVITEHSIHKDFHEGWRQKAQALGFQLRLSPTDPKAGANERAGVGFPTPLCPLHALSGIPCPTCGTTRAATALLHGDFKTPFLLNPLMAGSLMASGLYVVYAAVVVIGQLPRVRIESITLSEARMIRVLAILLIAANWLYLLLA